MSDVRKRVSYAGVFIALLFIGGYTAFEARRYLEGPIIVIDSPKSGESVEGHAVRVTGRGENLSYFYINGDQAYLDQDGSFSYLYTPPEGSTTLTALGRDRFNRSVTVTVQFTVRN